MSTTPEPTTFCILDPELALEQDVLLHLANKTSIVCANPLQEEVLRGTESSWQRAGIDPDACQRRFDALTEMLTRARDERQGLITMQGAWGRTYEVSAYALLEFGHQLETYVMLDDVFRGFDKVPDALVVVSSRPGFARVVEAMAASHFGSQVVMLPEVRLAAAQTYDARPRTRRTLSSSRALQLLGELADLARSPGKPRVIAFAHRQILSVRAELEDAPEVAAIGDHVWAATRAVARALFQHPVISTDVITNTLACLPGCDEVLWRGIVGGEREALSASLASASARLVALDLLSPRAIISPAWGGVEAHIQRRWCEARGRLFCVVQHGFQYGTRISPRTRRIDADIFYTWGPRYAAEWIDHDVNRNVTLVSVGDPGAVTTTSKSEESHHQRRVRVLVAPSSCFEFARGRYLSFWSELFDFITQSPPDDFEWVLRPHRILRNYEWLQQRALAVGVTLEPPSACSLDEAIARADVVLTSVSSVVINAMQGGCPAIVINLTGEPEFFSTDCPESVLGELDGFAERLREAIARRDEIGACQARFFASSYERRAPAEELCRDLIKRLER